MARLSNILRSLEGGRLAFYCPGCKTTHQVLVEEDNPRSWGWNKDVDKPTFTPSILTRSGHYSYDRPVESCYCTYNKKHPTAQLPYTCYRCHSYVTDGKIQFLSDCSHELANQTVDIPNFPNGDENVIT